MPTVLRTGPYRFHFFSHEPNEPPHVHVSRNGKGAKLWLMPVSVAANLGFRPKELGIIRKIVIRNQRQLVEAWFGYFDR